MKTLYVKGMRESIRVKQRQRLCKMETSSHFDSRVIIYNPSMFIKLANERMKDKETKSLKYLKLPMLSAA